MKKQLLTTILFLIATLVNLSLFAGGDETGVDCENALTYSVGESINLQFNEEQEKFYIEFEATETNLFLVPFYDSGTPTPFVSIQKVELFSFEECESLSLINSRERLTPKENLFLPMNGLDIEGKYLVVISRNSGLPEQYFSMMMMAGFIDPCPTNYNLTCNEIIKNGGFQYLSTQNIGQFYFQDSIICEWFYGFGTPEINAFDGSVNLKPNQFGNYICPNKSYDGIQKNYDFLSSKKYILNLDLKVDYTGQYSNKNPNFKIYLTNQISLDSISTTIPHPNISGKTIVERDYCSFKNLVKDKQLVAVIDSTKLVDYYKNFSRCIEPFKNYNRMILVSIPEYQDPATSSIDIDNVSLKEFETVDAGPDVTLDSYCEAKEIGPIDCPYKGAIYQWSPVEGLSHPNSPRTKVMTNTQTTYTLTVKTPDNNCTVQDQVVVTPSVTTITPDYFVPADSTDAWFINNVTHSTPTNNIVFQNQTFFFEGNTYFNSTKNFVFVNCEIYVKSGRKITLLRNGRIYLNNSKITSCDGATWQGIEMLGDDDVAQVGGAPMPTLRVENNSIIENAIVGVRTGTTSSGSYNNGTSGGTIITNNATFENNHTDVIFHPYQNFQHGTNPKVLLGDNSSFENTEFIYDNSTISGSNKRNVTLNQIDGVSFTACHFENQVLQTNIFERGTAIVATTSSFSVIENGVSNCHFEGYLQAISSTSTNPMFPVLIRKSTFENNARGVSIAGNDYSSIIQNTFKVPDFSGYGANFGLYMNYCNGYEIEENDFTYTGGGTATNSAGIVIVGNSSLVSTANKLYNNSFENLQTGSLLQGDNRLANNTGLQVLCNDYDANDYHVALESFSQLGVTYNPHIALNQGSNGAAVDAAGNTFADLCTGSAETDISAVLGASSFNYYHHTNALTIPNCETTAKVSNIPTQNNYTKSEACPSNLSGGGTGGGGNPGGGPFLISQGGSGSANNAPGLKSGKQYDDELLADYIRYHLLKDTLGLDSIIAVLDSSQQTAYQVRLLAAMSRRGDSSLGHKSLRTKFDKTAKTYISFQEEQVNSATSGKISQLAKQDPTHPYYIWARAKAFEQKGVEIPQPINLPQQRLKTNERNDAEIKPIIYPNPSTNFINIEFKAEVNTIAELYDVQGRKIKSVTLAVENQNHQLDIKSLNNGIYLLKVYQGEEIITLQKVVVQH